MDTFTLSRVLGLITYIKDAEDLPLYYSYTVGITSLWLLCPILAFIKNKRLTIPYTILIVCTVICCVVSTIMWKEFNNNAAEYSPKNFMYPLDIYTARAFFVLLIVMNLVYKPFSIYITICFAILVFLTYHIVGLLNDKGFHELSVYAHLLFRYFGWWWVWLTFGNEIGIGLIFVNIMYWFHIIYSIHFVCPSVDLTYKNAYNIGCAELTTIIVYIVTLLL